MKTIIRKKRNYRFLQPEYTDGMINIYLDCNLQLVENAILLPGKTNIILQGTCTKNNCILHDGIVDESGGMHKEADFCTNELPNCPKKFKCSPDCIHPHDTRELKDGKGNDYTYRDNYRSTFI